MWKRLRRDTHEGEEGSSQIMSDLALSMVGVMVIAFTGYILKFRSETVAQADPTREREQVIAELREELDAAKRRGEQLKQQAQQQTAPNGNPQLFGLNGPLTNVVFCLDLSGSMVGVDGPNQPPDRELAARFGLVKERLKRMVRSLNFQKFCVIGFGGQPHNMQSPRLISTSIGMAAATAEERQYACQQIDSWQAIGGTPTLPALKAAYAKRGVEHVVLLTDGLPTLEGLQDDVLQFVRQGSARGGRLGKAHRDSRIVIDVIGIGDQSSDSDTASMALIDFTRRVANATGGFFQAW